jgi:ApaG protein
MSDREVTLKGRKWVLRDIDGHQQVIEGDGIVGEEPTIGVGGSFSYNSFHRTHTDSIALGAFHGIDSDGQAIHCRIPEFEMKIPEPEES